MTTATRTFLEMRSPDALVPSSVPPESLEGVRIEQVFDCPPAFWRFLYVEVGRPHNWVDRLPWTDDDIRRYLTDPAVELWLMTVRGAPAGYFELRQGRDGSREIAYFGLLDAFHGRGLGGHLLTEAVRAAWRPGTVRVWLHTNTLDHPAALPNYLKRGFVIFHSESFVPFNPHPQP